MTRIRRMTVTGVAASLALLLALPVASGADSPASAPHTGPAPVLQLPQRAAARQAAQWLVSQFNARGFIPVIPGGSQADLSGTVQSVLSLAAANVDPTLAQQSLGYLEANVDAYVAQQGADGPGQLALLILDAEAVGVSPTDFGGTDLVTRLLATEQTTGPDAGLFGTENQAANYSAGGYQQGLALAALAAAGVTGRSQVGTAIAWLVQEQCPDGGWTTPDNTNNACNGTPADYAGPDTNSTALAIQGLAAQGALTSSVSTAALGFLQTGQDSDGGWSYYPDTSATPGVTDPDSTALVVQSLVALGVSPTSPPLVKGSSDPVSALLSFQLTSGSGAGAFFFPPGPSGADLLATYQAVPALAGLAFGFGPSAHSYWEVASDGGVFNFGNGAGFFGSMGGTALNEPIVGIAATADGKGYWEVASDGGVFAFGDAGFFGSMGGTALNEPIVGIAATADGKGYWEVASDGGVFAFGDAGFSGSMGGTALNEPIVGIAATADGKGYWEVASDGGVFAFGDAGFSGSMGGTALNEPIVGIAATADGKGYWEVASDGGVFAFGDAGFSGSMGGTALNKPIVGIAATPDGGGYWEVASDGGVFAFGDAGFSGSAGSLPLSKPVVGMAASLQAPA